MPRFSIPGRRQSGSSRPLSEAEQGRKMVVTFAFQAIVIFMVVVVVAVALISRLTGGSLTIPTSATGVLQSAHSPNAYGWTSESIRRVTFGGQSMSQSALRSGVVDLQLNRFQVVTAGVLPEQTTYISVGKITREITASASQSGYAPTLVNNVCGGQPPVPAGSLAYPTPANVLAAHPTIETSQGTFQGQQAWILNFKPTPTILRKLLWLDFFQQVTANFPTLQPWVLSQSELQAIDAGEVKTNWARLWVSRSDREMAQFDVKFQVATPGGATYRVLATLYPEQGHPLASLTSGQVSCPA